MSKLFKLLLRSPKFTYPSQAGEKKKRGKVRTSLGPVVQNPPSNAEHAGSIPVRGAKSPPASWPKNQNIKQKPSCNKFHEDFKNGPCEKNIFLKKRKS